MKPSWFVAISLFALLAGTSLAQTTFHMTITIPFDFQAYEKWMPAGDYELNSLLGSSGVLLRSVDAKNSTILLPLHCEVSQSATTPNFVFARYSGNHYLTAISVPNGLTLSIPASRTHKEMIRIAAIGEERTVLAGTPKPKR